MRASLASGVSFSKHNANLDGDNNNIGERNIQTSGNDSVVYAPSLTTKSIMKQQSVFSPVDSKRNKDMEGSSLANQINKKVHIVESMENKRLKELRMRAQRGSQLDNKLPRDIQSPIVNMNSSEQQRIRTSPMGKGRLDIDMSYLTEEQRALNR